MSCTFIVGVLGYITSYSTDTKFSHLNSRKVNYKVSRNLRMYVVVVLFLHMLHSSFLHLSIQ